MKPAPFRYAAPRTVPEVLELLAEHGDEAKLLAGGQSLLPLMSFRLARPSVLIDINRVPELDGIREEDGVLHVGATTRQAALERWSAGRPAWGLLHAALGLVGHGAIRNRGTVGGSIAHADPASELPAILQCLEGSALARGPGGEREVAAGELFWGPLTTSLQPDELLVEVRLPAPPPGAGWGFEEVARRHGDFALVGAAALVARGTDGLVSESRLALFGVGDTPVRAADAEQALRGQQPTRANIDAAARLVGPALEPASDLHADAEYRRSVAQVLAARALAAAVARCRSGNGKEGRA